MPIEAWYMDEEEGDQRAPHKLDPNMPVSKDEVFFISLFMKCWFYHIIIIFLCVNVYYLIVG